MPDITYTIKTEAELAGAQAAEAAMARQVLQAQLAGKAYAEQADKLKSLNAAIAQYTQHQAARADYQNSWKSMLVEKDLEGTDGSLKSIWAAQAAKQQSSAADAKKAAEGAYDQARIKADLAASLSKITPPVSQLSFPTFGPMLEKLRGLSFGTILSAVAGLTTAFKLAKDALGEFINEEKMIAKLDTAMSNAGQTSVEYKERLKELAEEMGKATATDHTEWLGVFAKLTQFGANSETITRSADAVKNLSGVLGGDLSTSAMLISKALQGNYEMFGRYGIVVKDAGTQTEKLDTLFKQLADRGGGQMEAMAETLGGRLTALSIAFGDVLLGVGRFIGESVMLQKSIEVLTTMFEGLEWAIGKPAAKLPQLSDAAGKNKISFQEAAGAAEAHAKAIKKIGDNADQTVSSLKKLSEMEQKNLSHADRMDKINEEIALKQVDLLGMKPKNQGGLSELEVLYKKAGIVADFANRKTKRDEDQDVKERERGKSLIEQSAKNRETEDQKSKELQAQAKIAKEMLGNKAQADFLKGVAGKEYQEKEFAPVELIPTDISPAGLTATAAKVAAKKVQALLNRQKEIAAIEAEKKTAAADVEKLLKKNKELGKYLPEGMTAQQTIEAAATDEATKKARKKANEKLEAEGVEKKNNADRDIRERRETFDAEDLERGAALQVSAMTVAQKLKKKMDDEAEAFAKHKGPRPVNPFPREVDPSTGLPPDFDHFGREPESRPMPARPASKQGPVDHPVKTNWDGRALHWSDRAGRYLTQEGIDNQTLSDPPKPKTAAVKNELLGLTNDFQGAIDEFTNTLKKVRTDINAVRQQVKNGRE